MKNAVKSVFDDLPEIIPVPKEFIHKKCTVIFTESDEEEIDAESLLKDFYGVLPDFPERSEQGDYEKREVL